MKIIYKLLVFGFVVLMSTYAAAETVKFSSSNSQTIMIELFTSQGCSSCPPAEHWLNRLEQNDQLWHKIVPLAFHVDYWDKLGWPDPYANHAHSMRQYRYQQQDYLSSVYTPGMLVNGREWRGWVRGETFPAAREQVGILSFTANQERIEVDYSKVEQDKVLNVALLGVGIVTKVARGENRNRELEQDFVVLSHKMYSYATLNTSGKWSIPMLTDILEGANRYAIAIWISETDDIAPIQSTGYWLPEEWFKKE